MKTNNINDAKLIEEYQSGNKTVITELVKRWHITFCKKAYWIVKDSELAKDIAQDSWKTIMDKLTELKDVNSFKGWAFRIVYNKSIDALKNNNRNQIKHQNFKNEQPEYSEIYNENTELKKQLSNAISQLPMHQQLVVKLFYLEEYSLKEISKTLKISVGTTKSRLFHAREKLKQTLKNKNYEN